jgi:hypothetical protein
MDVTAISVASTGEDWEMWVPWPHDRPPTPTEWTAMCELAASLTMWDDQHPLQVDTWPKPPAAV